MYTEVSEMAVRWGIAGAAKISHDFVTALASLPEGEHTVVGIAARDLSRAKTFANLHKIGNAYGNYKDLANDSNVEIVYIGVLNPQHLEVATLMLNNGKHVLCEKPLTLNLKQTTELINLAKAKGLFLMEAVWSRCFPTYEWIKKEIESGNLGEVKQVIGSFGISAPKVDRLIKKDLGGGGILDLGVYVLQLASFVYNGEKPISIKAGGHLNEDGVDISMSATLLYKEGRTATVMTHCHVKLPNEALIIGTKGTLRVPLFWCPTDIVLPSGETKSITLPEPKHPLNFINSVGLRYEAMEVRRCLRAGLKESPLISHKESLLLAELEDEIRRQIGVFYAED
ncbi:trans-1,2-dihydrobenzene-1,2-diol dehydrogenase isoform X1 [Neodiprion lecontei]|uniref:Trans-1,2-dihydrobenzene-1,2-diol dehydrogenase n=2 Tax=Neodiprion lecontei TaxID=441921 RepID=A0ABM3FTZ6_NEOLC|nr:trans-1,2-dihydrobenzene-1,2-diol dehydrogenase isoform X1 [Neodiprion lecontei]